MNDPYRLVVCGLGYAGAAIAARAVAEGWQVAGTSRDPAGIRAPSGVQVVEFGRAGPLLAEATHVVATAPPGEQGDPVLTAWRAVLAGSPRLRWVGYLSTTGVYGDRGGALVDEATPPAPGSERSARRVAAEQDWARLADRVAVDLFRVAGIYGPGRSALDDLRAGTARRVIRPGHGFGRIHRDDIARAVMTAAGQGRAPGVRVLHLVDDEPAESAVVIEEAARLLGVPPPPAVAYEQAVERMSPMARSFWAEHRRLDNAATKAALGIAWLYPTYREGLRGLLGDSLGSPVEPADGSGHRPPGTAPARRQV